MHFGRHGGVIVVRAFDFDLAFAMNVDAIQLQAGCRHFHCLEFQKAESALMVNVDG